MGSIYKRRYTTKTGEVKESPTWWLKYYRDGKPMRESANTTKEGEAKHLLKLREGAVARGEAVTPKAGRVKLRELAGDVLTEYKVNKRRSLKDIETRYRLHVLPFFGERRASSISTADINRFIQQRQDAGASNGEINRELTAMKRAYSLAIQAGKLLHKPHFPMLKEAPPRSGFFEREDFERVRSHLPQPLRGLITTAYISGWRLRSELLPLRWSEVDFAAGTIHLKAGTTKNDDARTFYFTDELREVMEAQRAYTDRIQRQQGVVVPWVFHRQGKPIAGLRRAWDRACYRAGLPCSVETEIGRDGKPRIKQIKAAAIIHDFRRTAVRNLVRAGVPESVAMKLTGHKTRSVFERYNVTSPSDLLNAAAMLNTFHNVMGTNPGTTAGNAKTAPLQVTDSSIRARSSAG